MPRSSVGSVMLSQNFSKKFYQKRFAISRAWMGSGGEVYIGAGGVRERFITNFVEKSIKNKK